MAHHAASSSSSSSTVVTPGGIRNLKAARLAALPESALGAGATRSSLKEELVLEFAEHVRRQFVQLYPQLPPLLLSPANEAGLPKFVCTTIRPTLPPVRELYEASSCARFVAQLVTYEPLDPPTQLPPALASPALTLATRRGDCLDLSVLLVSFLIGAGYDAYVVVGTAPRWVTLKHDGLTRERSFVAPPDALNRVAHMAAAERPPAFVPQAAAGPAGARTARVVAAVANKYKPAPQPNLDSELLKAKAKAKAAAAAIRASEGDGFDSEDETEAMELARLRAGLPPPPPVVPALERLARLAAEGSSAPADAAPSQPPSDPLEGQRVHAWVLVREGRREVGADFFVEPSTGEIYPARGAGASSGDGSGGSDVAADASAATSVAAAGAAEAAPYLTVETLFNHRNCWINMQGQPLLPRQSTLAADGSTPLGDALATALMAGSGASTGGGGAGLGRGLAATGAAGALAAGAGAALKALEAARGVRPEMLSPYMAALAALKQVQMAEAAEARRLRKGTGLVEKSFIAAPAKKDKDGKKGAEADAPPEAPDDEAADEEAIASVGRVFAPPPGAPTLSGAAAHYTLAHPRPPKPKVDFAALRRAKDKEAAERAAAAADSAAAVATEGGGEGDGAATGSDGEGGAAVGNGGGEGDGEGGADAAAAAPEPAPAPAAAEPEPDGGASEPALVALTGPGGAGVSSKPGTAGSALRPSAVSRPNTRGRPAGRHGAGPWKEVMAAQTTALQAHLARLLLQQDAALPTLSQMSWELTNGDLFEHVLLPYDAHVEDEHGHGHHGGHGGHDDGHAGHAGGHTDGHAGAGAAGAAGIDDGAAAADGKEGGPEVEGEGGDNDGDGEDGDDGEGKGGDEGEGGDKGAGVGGAASGSRPASAAVSVAASGAGVAVGPGAEARESSSAGGAHVRVKAKSKGDRYAGLKLEHDGEHLLDLPPSWSAPLVVDRHSARLELDLAFGAQLLRFKGRLEQYALHAHPFGLVARSTVFADSARLAATSTVEVFQRRRDGLYKRVRRAPSASGGGLSVIEEHFERGRGGGLALLVEEPGVGRDMYFYAGARLDGLLRRRELFDRKIFEYYDEGAPNRLWYRSITLATPEAVRAAATAAHHALTHGLPPPPPALTVEVGPHIEARVRKMAEKYRRDSSATPVPSYADLAKLTFNVDAGTIEARYHSAVGCVGRAARLYRKASGAMEQLTRDPSAPLAPPRPYDVDVDFRRACQLERECHAAARSMAKSCVELVHARQHEVQHVELDRTLFEVALERAREDAPLEEEAERKEEDNNAEPDYLLPFLLAAKCAIPSNPSEKEARRADKECRLSFRERLGERAAIIQRRLDEENEKLLRRQQAFARNRDHTEAAEVEFEQYQGDAHFRISILEQRLERHNTLLPRAVAEMEARLLADLRLQVIHDPAAWRERMGIDD